MGFWATVWATICTPRESRRICAGAAPAPGRLRTRRCAALAAPTVCYPAVMKPDTKCTSEVQKRAQEHLRRMLAASAHLDNIDAMGGVDDLAAHHQQQAVDVRAVANRCIENLTAANTDEECAEALCAITDILRPVVQKRPLQ